MLAEKRCPKCSTIKPMAEWGRNKSSRDGFQGWCKPCMSKTVGDFHKRRLEVVRGKIAKVTAGTDSARALAEQILSGPNLSYYRDVDDFCSRELEPEL